MASSSVEPPMSWRRTQYGLEPACDKSRAWFGKLKLGEIVAAEGRKPRNLKHHRKYWILLTIVHQNSEQFDSPEAVHFCVKAALQRGKWIQPGKAKRAVFIPDSTSFASMDQSEFDRFYNDAVNVCAKHFLGNMTPDQLDAIVMEF